MYEFKQCLRCDAEFPAKGIKTYCSELCRRRAEKSRRGIRHRAQKRALRPSPLLRIRVRESCRECGTSEGMDWWVRLDVSDSTKYQYQYWCEPCRRASDVKRAAEWVRNNPDKVRRTSRYVSKRKHTQCVDCSVGLTGGQQKRCAPCAATQKNVGRSPMRVRTCPCGCKFESTNKKRTYCGNDCPAKVGYGPPAPGLLQIRPLFRYGMVECRQCGIEFTRRRSNQVYCSPDCSYRWQIEIQKDRLGGLYRTAAQTGRVKEAMHWRYALIEYLRDRDGNRCALCGSVMNFKDSTGPRGDNDDGASVDHVVPWSLTRDDSLSNLQLAHWSCNRSKGARVPGVGEQLRLVG